MTATPGADRVTDALLEDWARIITALGPPAFRRTGENAVALASTVPLAGLNNVFTARAGASRFEVEALLRLLAGRGLPHQLQVRPGARPELAAAARDRGMTAGPPVPLMALPAAASTAAGLEARLAGRLQIRQLEPAEAALHASLLAAGFDAPAYLFEQFLPPAVLAIEGMRCYVGSLDGQPVTTALALTQGEAVGVYNVATLPEHRGQGYGSSVTARAVLDGFAAGGDFAHLQSSTAGHRAYLGLGFVDLERWSAWADPGGR